MTSPFYTAAAMQDLADILKYIARDKPGAAMAWVEKIEAKCLLIASQPETGELKRQLGFDVRASVAGRYVIFHRRRNQRVEILRIIPGDRKINSTSVPGRFGNERTCRHSLWGRRRRGPANRLSRSPDGGSLFPSIRIFSLR